MQRRCALHWRSVRQFCSCAAAALGHGRRLGEQVCAGSGGRLGRHSVMPAWPGSGRQCAGRARTQGPRGPNARTRRCPRRFPHTGARKVFFPHGSRREAAAQSWQSTHGEGQGDATSAENNVLHITQIHICCVTAEGSATYAHKRAREAASERLRQRTEHEHHGAYPQNMHAHGQKTMHVRTKDNA